MVLQKMSDDQLLVSAESAFAVERNAARNIFSHLKEIESRRLYAKRGFENMYAMLIGYFGQSETAAGQRLKTLSLMKAVPGVEEELASGSICMSTAAMAQRKIETEERLTGKKVSKEKKAEIVESISGKTLAEAEIELFKHLPETVTAPRTFERRVSEDAVRMGVTLPNDVHAMMIRLKELWAHVDPKMDNVEVIRRAFAMALDKVDPTLKEAKTASESEKHRSSKRFNYYGVGFDQALWTRAGSQCEYTDEKTGRRCNCKFGLQREHAIPIALGGTNQLANMQLLCRTHNGLRARQVFGNAKIDFHQRRGG